MSQAAKYNRNSTVDHKLYENYCVDCILQWKQCGRPHITINTILLNAKCKSSNVVDGNLQ